MSRLTQLYIWPGKLEQVEDVVLSCLTCQQTKPRVTLPAGQMDPVKIPDLTPFSVIAIDTIDLPRTPRGFKHVLMIEDVFTKFIICVPLKAVTSSNIITALTDHLFLEHGIPSILLSDQATVFRSTEFQNMCSSYNIQSHFSPKYSPWTNSSERFNRVVKTCIASFSKSTQRDWDLKLKYLVFSIRTAVSEVTKTTPVELVYGRRLKGFYELFDPIHVSEVAVFDPNQYKNTLQEKL